MEKRYQGERDSAMMGDYIWCLIREDDNAVHKKKISFKRAFLRFFA